MKYSFWNSIKIIDQTMTSIQNDLICLAEKVSSEQCIGSRTVNELNIKEQKGNLLHQM